MWWEILLGICHGEQAKEKTKTKLHFQGCGPDLCCPTSNVYGFPRGFVKMQILFNCAGVQESSVLAVATLIVFRTGEPRWPEIIIVGETITYHVTGLWGVTWRRQKVGHREVMVGRDTGPWRVEQGFCFLPQFKG
jgi:hypothetical protein